jgi:hypothetical protein
VKQRPSPIAFSMPRAVFFAVLLCGGGTVTDIGVVNTRPFGSEGKQ